MWWVNTDNQTWWVFRTFVQFVMMTGFQLLGSYSAALVVKSNSNEWGDLGQIAWPPDDNNGTVILFNYKQSDKRVGGGWLFLEEFCAVFVLLIGLLHLMHKNSPDLFQNSYWKNVDKKTDPDTEDERANPIRGFQSEMDVVVISTKSLLEKTSEIQDKLSKLDLYVKVNPRRMSTLKALPNNSNATDGKNTKNKNTNSPETTTELMQEISDSDDQSPYSRQHFAGMTHPPSDIVSIDPSKF